MNSLFELATDRDKAALAVDENARLSIWQLNGLYQHNLPIDEINAKMTTLTIIDQCQGVIPELFHKTTLRKNSRQSLLYPMLLLDSNAARYLRKYVDGTLKPELTSQIEPLLEWAAVNNINFNPGFSLMETISGSDNPELHGKALIKLSLLLSGFNGPEYLESGKLSLSPQGTDYLLQNFGTVDLDQIADTEYKRLPKETNAIVEASYASLLKISLIESARPRLGFEERLDLFIKFLEVDLCAILPGEIIVAILFFAGKFGKFIPLATKDTFKKRLASVRSSAWDLYLARMSPLFLGESGNGIIRLPFVLTSDKRLKLIAEVQRLYGVIKEEGQPPIPIIATDIDRLKSHAARDLNIAGLQDKIEQRSEAANLDSGRLKRLTKALEDENRSQFDN